MKFEELRDEFLNGLGCVIKDQRDKDVVTLGFTKGYLAGVKATEKRVVDDVIEMIDNEAYLYKGLSDLTQAFKNLHIKLKQKYGVKDAN